MSTSYKPKVHPCVNVGWNKCLLKFLLDHCQTQIFSHKTRKDRLQTQILYKWLPETLTTPFAISQMPVGLDPSLYSVVPRSFIISLVDPTSFSRTVVGNAPSKGLAFIRSCIFGTFTRGGFRKSFFKSVYSRFQIPGSLYNFKIFRSGEKLDWYINFHNLPGPSHEDGSSLFLLLSQSSQVYEHNRSNDSAQNMSLALFSQHAAPDDISNKCCWAKCVKSRGSVYYIQHTWGNVTRTSSRNFFASSPSCSLSRITLVAISLSPEVIIHTRFRSAQ